MVDVHVLFQRGGANLQQIATSPCESVIIAKSDLVEGQGQSWVFAPETDKRAAEAGQRGVKSLRLSRQWLSGDLPSPSYGQKRNYRLNVDGPSGYQAPKGF